MKKVSIIIPVFNICDYIAECVHSLINQTYSNIEIILVDDGSTDGSGELCDNLAEQDKRINVIHKKNGGVSDARNIGLDASTGEYISFVDGDDMIAAETIKTLVWLLEENKVDISAIIREDHHYCTGEIIIREGDRMLLHMLNTSTFEIWGKLFKKSIFREIRFPVGKKHEDLYILPKILLGCKNKIAIYHKGLYYYRQREESIMGIARTGEIIELLQCCLSGIDEIKYLSKDKKLIIEMQKWYFYHILWYYYNIIGNVEDDVAKKSANKEISLFYRKTLRYYLINSKVLAKDKIRFIWIWLKHR